MVEMTASVDGAAANAVVAALTRFGTACGEIAQTGPKVMALRVCNSLRARTKKAKKAKARKDWEAEPIHHKTMMTVEKNGRKYSIPTPSPFITNPHKGHGLSNGATLHRYWFTTRKGTSEEKRFAVAAYHHTKVTKRGKVVTDKSAEVRELKAIHARNIQSGLAVKSWSWAKRGIVKRGPDPIYERRKGDKRNPKDAVSGSSSATGGIVNGAGTAEIHNHLDYIHAALEANAVDEALNSAAVQQVYNDTLAQMKRIGMSAKDAAKAAEQTAHVFKRDVLRL